MTTKLSEPEINAQLLASLCVFFSWAYDTCVCASAPRIVRWLGGVARGKA